MWLQQPLHLTLANLRFLSEKIWYESWLWFICWTYKNGNKKSISSHTKCNKKIHEPNEISYLNTDDVRITSTVITVFKTRAFLAFDLFAGCFVNLNLFIILSESCRLYSTHENSKNPRNSISTHSQCPVLQRASWTYSINESSTWQLTLHEANAQWQAGGKSW